MSMACFAVRGKGGILRLTVSLLMFWLLLLCRQSTVETSLDFRGNGDKSPTKKGVAQYVFFTETSYRTRTTCVNLVGAYA